MVASQAIKALWIVRLWFFLLGRAVISQLELLGYVVKLFYLRIHSVEMVLAILLENATDAQVTS